MQSQTSTNTQSIANTVPVANATPVTNPDSEQIANEFFEAIFRSSLEAIKQELINVYPQAPTAFISYAWGSGQESKVHKLAEYILAAGIALRFDLKDNRPNTFISGFIQELDTVDHIILIGTPNLMEKCNKANYRRAKEIEFGGEKLQMDEKLPVVSREMARIQYRLKQFRKQHLGHVNSFIVPICLGTPRTEYAKVFPRRIADIAGYGWENDLEYNVVLKLLTRLLPNLEKFIEEKRQALEKLQTGFKEWVKDSSKVQQLQLQINAYCTYKKSQQQALLDHVEQQFLEFMQRFQGSIRSVPTASVFDVTALKEAFKERYRAYGSIPLLLYDRELPIKDIYINLSLVETKRPD